jgi:hypothetical protein
VSLDGCCWVTNVDSLRQSSYPSYPQKDRDSTLTGLHHAELVFLHPVGSAGHVVHLGASEVQNVNALFFMVGWGLYGFDKKRAGTRYADLVFLHPVGSAGYIVHSGASGAQNVDTLFFMLR